ncbi:MAG TPA: hypothetical protein VHM91_21045 [Verrucomicrobiales bacterium]|jgi:hypothetical protein|nr:hypothetical protein [Verrucomicrobiales bacterium]
MPSPSDIPREFHSEYEERPFQSCTRCGEMLEEITGGYQIFKLYQGSEAIYEYALCHPCHAGVIKKFSRESRERLAEFHRQRVSLNLGRWRCAVCGNSRGEEGEAEFSLSAACQARSLIHELMVCGACRREMQSLLSPETRKVWDRFVDENLPGLPANSISPADLVPA